MENNKEYLAIKLAVSNLAGCICTNYFWSSKNNKTFSSKKVMTCSWCTFFRWISLLFHENREQYAAIAEVLVVFISKALLPLTVHVSGEFTW